MRSKNIKTRKKNIVRKRRFGNNRWVVGLTASLLVATVGTVFVIASHAATDTAEIGDPNIADTTLLTPTEVAADAADTDSPTAPSPDTGAPFFAYTTTNAPNETEKARWCLANATYHWCISTDNMNIGTVLRERSGDFARTLQWVQIRNTTFTVNGNTIVQGYLKFPDQTNRCVDAPAGTNLLIVQTCNSGLIGIIWGLANDGHGHLYLVNRHYSKATGHLYMLSGPNPSVPSWRFRVHEWGAYGWYQRLNIYAQN